MTDNRATQGDYALRRVVNDFDLITGRAYHPQLLTLHEFLSKPESLFFYDADFFQIPGYIMASAEIQQVEESAREYVVQYIIDEFEDRLLGMQNYVRWGKLFKNLCDALTPAFWAQVNMHDLMMAKELEMDDNEITHTNTGTRNLTGSGGTTTETTTSGQQHSETTQSQDIKNRQETDSSTREGTATVVNAEDKLTKSLDYDWTDAADNIHEILSRAGDTSQHTDAKTTTDGTNSTQSTSNTINNNTKSDEGYSSTSTDNQHLTNKMYMQERQWAIDTAQKLLPLRWLTASLRPMFYMIY